MFKRVGLQEQMRVNVLTPYRFGGPFKSGQDLVCVLNQNGIQAKHIHTLFDLSKSCLYQGADIVHTTVPIPLKLWKKPIVLTVHGDYSIEKNMWQRFAPKAIAEANVITTPSQYLKQKLGLENAIVIPNALFPEKFEPVEHRGNEALNLVTVTKFYFLDKAKGLISIAKILEQARYEKIRYTVVGDGTYLNQVKREVAKCGVNMEFTGFLSDPRQALANGDIFLYYSYHDNFPTVILEAMASGLPVITNDVGAVSEIIENEKDGYIATSDDAYLKYLLNLVNNRDLRSRVGENARKSIETKFNWEKIVDRYIEVYKMIL